ncbi:hypothetical protein WR25_17547 [Diploscapter pachys]|uniref:Uncharacterized protein n=1 Tax=Diploscapter pachys TaxID=2018661 RepID=A0A2A2J439_9BILA|nr:hypothetical protein WR25_17547 [Diploscapter pachys]
MHQSNAPTLEASRQIVKKKNKQRTCAVILLAMIDGFFIFSVGHYYLTWHLLILIVIDVGLLFCNIEGVLFNMPLLMIPNIIAKIILWTCLLYVVGNTITVHQEDGNNSTLVDSQLTIIDHKYSEHDDYVTRRIKDAIREHTSLYYLAPFFLVVYSIVIQVHYQLFKRLLKDDEELHACIEQPQKPQTVS